MKAYSAERKEALLRRMMPPENALVSALARETGITEQTLYAWRRQMKAQGVPVPGDGKNPEAWSSEDKFAVVLETAPLNEAELAEYCRRKGLYPEQIAAWREACRSANANAGEQAREQRLQSKGDKKRIQQLEKELQRKEKALAEAAALLILRKKPRRFGRCVTNAGVSLRCCTEDGSRPPEIGLQEQVSNRPVLLRPKGVVVSDCGKGIVKVSGTC